MKPKSHLLDFVYRFYAEMKSHESIITYEGSISRRLMEVFADILLERMTSENVAVPVRQQFYDMMVGCLTNIMLQTNKKDNSDEKNISRNLLLITRADNLYHVITGTELEISKTGELKSFLDIVNMTDPEDSDSRFKDQPSKGKMQNSGIAEVDFIDIQRRTGRRLEYHFLPLDSRYAFFLLDSIVSEPMIPNHG